MSGAIENGNDMMSFLSCYEFWTITRSTSGRIQIVVRAKNGEYSKIWTRKSETIYQAMERCKRDIYEIEGLA